MATDQLVPTSSVQAERRKPLTRDMVPKGDCLCDHCNAKCCRYFCLPIEVPESAKEYDYIRWFLLHGHSSVFVEDESWYLLVHTVCKHLQPDNRCGIYETRPEICREYSTDACEFDEDSVYEKYFETPEQVAEYMEAVLQTRRGCERTPEPPLLPILPN